MPVDYYPNLALEELQALLARLQARQAGGAITEASAGGGGVGRAEGAGNSRTEVEVLRVLYSLYVRARGTEEEGRWPNPYERRVTRTRPAFL